MDIKMEKANAILRYKRLQKITAIFRFVEFCVLFIILSRFSTQLPFALKLSGEYFRGLSLALISPRFVFVVGNAIVIVLFFKSGQFSGEKSNAKIDFYDEFVKNCEKNRSVYSEQREKQGKQSMIAGGEITDTSHSCKEKKIHRSQSENLRRAHHEEPRRELRRSVTERCRKSVNLSEKPAAISYPEDELSSEEFRRTVEAFIARQQRLLREEEFSPMVFCES